MGSIIAFIFLYLNEFLLLPQGMTPNHTSKADKIKDWFYSLITLWIHVLEDQTTLDLLCSCFFPLVLLSTGSILDFFMYYHTFTILKVKFFRAIIEGTYLA